MKHIIPLTALLLTGLLMLSGCNPTNPELPPSIPMEAGPAPTLLEVLELSEADVEGLDEMFEKPDVSDEKEGVTLRALESCGDGRLLYVLFSLTLPEGMDLDKGGLEKLWSESYFAAKGSSAITGFLRYDPQTRQFYFLSELDFFLSPGQAASYEVNPFRALGLDDEENLVLTWTPKNQAPQVSAQNEYGSCTLTPLSMNLDIQADGEDFGVEIAENYFLSDYIEVHYQDGSVLHGTRGGGGAGDGPTHLHTMRPSEGTLFRLQDLERVTLFDCVFSFPQD